MRDVCRGTQAWRPLARCCLFIKSIVVVAVAFLVHNPARSIDGDLHKETDDGVGRGRRAARRQIARLPCAVRPNNVYGLTTAALKPRLRFKSGPGRPRLSVEEALFIH